MRVHKLPPKVHEALHKLIDESGGTADPVIEDVLENVEELKSKEEEQILAKEARKLLHCKILFPKAPNEDEERLETQINNIIDNHIDEHYARWLFKHEALSGDVKMAIGALGVSALVGILLSIEGLGNSENIIWEATKLATPSIASDLLTNATAAYPFVKEDQLRLNKMKELGQIVWKEYKIPLGVGMIWAFIGGLLSREFYDQRKNLESGLALASVIIGPAWVTNAITKKVYSNRNRDGEINLHPVQKSLLIGGVVGTVATFAVGASGQLENPVMVTTATSAVEPVVSICESVRRLIIDQREYMEEISQDPLHVLRENVPK